MAAAFRSWGCVSSLFLRTRSWDAGGRGKKGRPGELQQWFMASLSSAMLLELYVPSGLPASQETSLMLVVNFLMAFFRDFLFLCT